MIPIKLCSDNQDVCSSSSNRIWVVTVYVAPPIDKIHFRVFNPESQQDLCCNLNHLPWWQIIWLIPGKCWNTVSGTNHYAHFMFRNTHSGAWDQKIGWKNHWFDPYRKSMIQWLQENIFNTNTSASWREQWHKVARWSLISCIRSKQLVANLLWNQSKQESLDHAVSWPHN